MKYIIVGAGLFGSVIAERIANVLGEPVEIFEKRNHTGGNCHSFIDSETGVECHSYGTHIFHTEIPEVWEYITRFGGFNRYRHKVLARHGNKTYRMPVNLGTINALYDKNLAPEQARDFLAERIAVGVKAVPANLEEKAISLVGSRIYEALIKNYTRKQWNRDPRDLPEGIITRLPVRYNYNDEYFDDFWQGLPLAGYNALFEKMLSHPLITVHLGMAYKLPHDGLTQDTILIYTGMPDQLFNYKYGKLEWRSLRFEWDRPSCQDYQGCGQMNYCDLEPAFTRIHEYKHYHPERKEIFTTPRTVICREYPLDYGSGGEPCYPVNNQRNNRIHALYLQEATQFKGLILGGRLASYRYWNMDKTIANALETFNNSIQR